jgi:hypothetical protein
VVKRERRRRKEWLALGKGLAVWAAAVACGCTPLVPERTPEPAQAPPAWSGPHIAAAEPDHDFGSVEQGAVVDHRFEVVNQGDQALEIKSVKSSCGCSATLESSKALAPGERGWVEASLDTIRLSGPQVKAIRVKTNDPAQPELTLTLHGTVLADVVAEPRQVFFGRLGRGEAASSVVNVSLRQGDLAITGVKVEGGRVKVRSEPLDAPETGMRLVVTLPPSRASGRINDRILVTTTSGRQPVVAIPILASVEGAVEPAEPLAAAPAPAPAGDATRTAESQARGRGNARGGS